MNFQKRELKSGASSTSIEERARQRKSTALAFIGSSTFPDVRERLVVPRNIVAWFGLWLIWLGYLATRDMGAMYISLIFVPTFGVVTWWAFSSRNIVAQAFSAFMFFAQAFGAPFFWMNRDNYQTFGFGSVGLFRFDLVEFFVIYVWVITIYVSLVGSIHGWDHVIWQGSKAESWLYRQQSARGTELDTKKGQIRFDGLIAVLILLIMVPLNVVMATNNIGTLGIINDPLPYRLTGILVYTRSYFAPLLILLLFYKSTRNWGTAALIIIYAVFVGLSSASRGAFLFNLLPFAYFAFLEKSKAKKIVAVTVGLFGFFITSAAREYTFNAAYSAFSYSDAIRTAVLAIMYSGIKPLDILGGIANRLNGAQDFVLAFQFHRDDTWSAMIRYFLMGGRADAIVPNLGRDLFDIDLEGTGYGVGIGTMAYLLILGHSDPLVMPVAVLILGLLVSSGNFLLHVFLAKLSYKYSMPPRLATGPLRFAVGAVMALFLYQSSLNVFYLLAQALLITIIVMRILPTRS